MHSNKLARGTEIRLDWRLKLSGHGGYLRLRGNELFWNLFGCLAFVPYEVIFDGLWLAYFQLIVLVFASHKAPKTNVYIYFAWGFCILASTVLNPLETAGSIVNPLVIGLGLAFTKLDSNAYKAILRGIYFAALIYVGYMMVLVARLDLLSLAAVMVSRDWGTGVVIGFGNGLAMMFAFVMLLAYRQSKFILAVLFFLGGVLTTSRVPFVAAGIIIAYEVVIRRHNFRRKVICCGLLMGVYFFLMSFGLIPSGSDLEFLMNRFGETEDRFEVYTLAINQISQSPFLGIGAGKLPFYEHAHNSFLQVLLKYGFVGLTIWGLMWIVCFFRGVRFFNNIDFLMLIVVVSMFQIGIHHPNVVLLLLVFRGLMVFEGRRSGL